MKPFVLLLTLCLIASAQSPAPSPCSPAELRAAMAEARAAAAEARAEVRALRQQSLERENADQRAQLNSNQRDLAVGKKNAELSVAAQEKAQATITELKQSLAEQRILIAILTAERDKLASKIANANGRFTCEFFHVGCIGAR
jgi:hypothetical protein